MKIGVFDSGIGGKSIANAIQAALPDAIVSFKSDKENLPYGSKTSKQLELLVIPFIDSFIEESCDVIVIACNTVTTNIITKIRKHSKTPVIGIEPMIKPAAIQTKTKKIAVCATPATLKSQRYKELKALHGVDLEILEPDCSDWSIMIEAKKIDRQKIDKQIRDVCSAGVDVIVLGCTHYHWIQEEIQEIASTYSVSVIQPEDAIVRRLQQVIAQLV